MGSHKLCHKKQLASHECVCVRVCVYLNMCLKCILYLISAPLWVAHCLRHWQCPKSSMRHAACSMQHARWVMIAGLGALVLHTSLKQADSQRPEMSELRRAESRSEQSPAKLVRGAHRYIYGRRQAPPGSCWTDTLRSYLWDTIWAVRWPCRHQNYTYRKIYCTHTYRDSASRQMSFSA